MNGPAHTNVASCVSVCAQQRSPSLPSLDEALRGERVPEAIKRRLAVVPISYWSFDHRQHTGYLIVAKDLAQDVRRIFDRLAQARFPIAKIVPLSRYNWSDERSMADNNTSAFNYRVVPGTDHLSLHAYGRAIDINPRWNPYEHPSGISPPGARRNPRVPGTIHDGDSVVRAFARHGWRWGGHFHRWRDWQHFDKRAPRNRASRSPTGAVRKRL